MICAGRVISTLLAGLFLTLPSALAWAADPPPGTYIRKGGGDSLVVSLGGARALKFRLNARGANGHVCDLRGFIVAGTSTSS